MDIKNYSNVECNVLNASMLHFFDALAHRLDFNEK